MTGKFENLTLSGYKITYNPAELDSENGITPEIRIHLDKTLKKLLKGAKNLNKEIETLIARYPQIPQFKNYLSSYYSNIGQHEKAFEINNNIIKEHPEYLFGKINLALQYLRKNQFSKIPEILGDALEIKSLYPDRDIFHIEEVLSFYQIAVYYYIETGDIEAAEMRHD
jgi:tetratricopeptide (TPR) repeat protein